LWKHRAGLSAIAGFLGNEGHEKIKCFAIINGNCCCNKFYCAMNCAGEVVLMVTEECKKCQCPDVYCQSMAAGDILKRVR